MIQTTCCGCWVEWWRPTLQNLYFNVVFRKSQNNGESANTHPKTGLFWGSVSTFSYPRILVFLPLRFKIFRNFEFENSKTFNKKIINYQYVPVCKKRIHVCDIVRRNKNNLCFDLYLTHLIISPISTH